LLGAPIEKVWLRTPQTLRLLGFAEQGLALDVIFNPLGTNTKIGEPSKCVIKRPLHRMYLIDRIRLAISGSHDHI
jgi:hypothetical protein